MSDSNNSKSGASLTLETLQEAMQSLAEMASNSRPLYYMSPQQEQILKDLLEFEKTAKQRRERKVRTMKHPGVILRNRRSKVEWRVEGERNYVLPSHLNGWRGDKDVTRTVVRSVNSGRKKEISPLLHVERYDVVYVPEAAKVLYGWEED